MTATGGCERADSEMLLWLLNDTADRDMAKYT